jgi:ketosteroid isomerase-like protein
VPSRPPDRVAGEFAGALLNRDPDGAAAHFRTEAVFLTPDGTEVSGRDAIRGVLRQVTSSRVDLQIRLGRTLAGESTALATQFWRRRDDRFELETTATLVLTREHDRWAIAIAAPWG